MLTARGGQDERLQGFDAGADDYLAKPFVPAELLARMRAVVRRSEGRRLASSAEIAVGSVHVAPEQRQAWRDGRLLDLTEMEYELLELLVRAGGRVVSRDEICAALHQRKGSPSERAIDVHMSHLRKKLGEGGDRLLQTVRGVGFRFRPGD